MVTIHSLPEAIISRQPVTIILNRGNENNGYKLRCENKTGNELAVAIIVFFFTYNQEFVSTYTNEEN